MQRVLVLGANGFIGSRVVAALAASDWAQPIAATRRAIPRTDVKTIQLDATDGAALRGALTGVDAVVNCITGDYHTIVRNAAALFAAAAVRVVHLSSLAAYGSMTGVVDETHTLRGDLDAYSAAKAEAERIAAGHRNVVLLRPGIVYGPESAWWSDRIARLLLARRLGDLGAGGQGTCNLVYVADVVSAIMLALRKSGIDGMAFNLAAPHAPSWNGYFTQYAAALGVPAAPISRRQLWLEIHLLTYLYKLRELGAALVRPAELSAPPLRPWLLTLCRHRITLDARRAETELGMRWTPLADGLRATAAWFLGRATAGGGLRA